MRERFVLDRKQNILFINFAGLKIDSREQVDDFAALVRENYEAQGRRLYAVVNYEGTEIAPDIVDYYGERIKELADRYALWTVRYSSSGFTRSVLRYLGAAKDLESNTYATRDEAIRAIQEIESRTRSENRASVWALADPRRSILGKLMLLWFGGLLIVLLCGLLAPLIASGAESSAIIHAAALAAAGVLLVMGIMTGAVLFKSVIKPLGQMGRVAERLAFGHIFDPLAEPSNDEVGRLARALDEAARQLRRDIERLSGLYHISLVMGTGTAVSRIGELLTRKIARLLDAEMCVILLYDERERAIIAQLPAHGVNDEHVRFLRSSTDEKNVATRVLKSAEAYLTNDAANDALISQAATALLGIKNMLAVPLQAGEQTIGTLEVMNKQSGFVEEDKRLVTIFASQAAHQLANAQLFEQVHRSEERYRQIFESALDGLYRSAPDGRLLTVNPAMAMMLGYESADAMAGLNLFSDLFVDGAAAARLAEELNGCGQALDVECRLQSAAGDAVPARLSVRVVTDKADNEAYHLGIVKDITEQQRLAERLILSERLAVMGELVAGVAHEVRNPLFGITTTLSALARRLEDRDAIKPFLDVVMTEVNHLNHLMEQLLEHSRPVKLDNDVSDIGTLVQEVLGEFQVQAKEKQVAVAFAAGQPAPGLRIDRRKMHGVFANLLDNALQHTAPGGAVRVVVESAAGDGRDASAVHIEFSDTGTGIAAGDLGRIFEPFFTTRAGGTGLGLAIVRKTIHDHGGTITARSNVGQGTAFIIDLPAR